MKLRVLVATTAGGGHFGPLVPFAEALRAAGHEVFVTAPASFAPAVERAGFVFHPFDDAPTEELEAVFAGLGALPPEERNKAVIGEMFGRIDTRCALPGVRAVVETLRPDIIVRESTEYASYILAEDLGIPHVHIAIGLASFGAMAFPTLEEPLVALGAAPGLAGLRTAPTMTMLPESFEDPDVAVPAGWRRFRAEADDADGRDPDPLPDWWPPRSESQQSSESPDPLVYVTFGSVAAGLDFFPGFYRAVTAALADVPVRVLLTVGDAGDPEALAPLPANVHVEKWWPQRAAMAHASAMVGHGGMGTTLAGLVAGMPMVVVPLFADQPDNARRVEAIGAGITLPGGPESVGRLGDAVHSVLGDPSYRTAAGRVAEEIRRLPPASESVSWLEQIAGR